MKICATQRTGSACTSYPCRTLCSSPAWRSTPIKKIPRRRQRCSQDSTENSKGSCRLTKTLRTLYTLADHYLAGRCPSLCGNQPTRTCCISKLILHTIFPGAFLPAGFCPCLSLIFLQFSQTPPFFPALLSPFFPHNSLLLISLLSPLLLRRIALAATAPS